MGSFWKSFIRMSMSFNANKSYPDWNKFVFRNKSLMFYIIICSDLIVFDFGIVMFLVQKDQWSLGSCNAASSYGWLLTVYISILTSSEKSILNLKLWIKKMKIFLLFFTVNNTETSLEKTQYISGYLQESQSLFLCYLLRNTTKKMSSF